MAAYGQCFPVHSPSARASRSDHEGSVKWGAKAAVGPRPPDRPYLQPKQLADSHYLSPVDYVTTKGKAKKAYVTHLGGRCDDIRGVE
jgi:hypothetical protein